MKPIAVCDNETDPFKRYRTPRAFLTGFFDGKRTRTFWNEETLTVKYRGKKIRNVRRCVWECWQAMRKELRGYYIYWHNGGKFDAREFLPLLYADGFKLKPIKGRMARFSHEDGTEFRDSYCLLPVSLKATGEKKDIDYRKMERAVRWRHRDEIIDYWKQDLRVLFDKVSEFVQEYGFGMTMAGRTFDQLKKNFDLNPPRANANFDRNFRRFYYGGRCEFFELGHCPGRFVLIDINSAYPHAMLKEHAFGLKFKASEKLPRKESELQTSFIRFVGECDGGLPHRLGDGSLSFGPYSGEFFVTGWEFIAARKAGVVRVLEISEVLVPTETKNFSRFVNHFYKRKVEAKKGSSEELFAKLFLNSAYGRFALNPKDFRDVIMTDHDDEPEENKVIRKKIAALVRKRHPRLRGKTYQETCVSYFAGYEGGEKWELANSFEDVGVSIWERPVEIKSGDFFNVATAASITGCVRAFLFESLRSCKRGIYCDTDSIICETSGNLALGRALGEWKVEAVSASAGVWIAGKKLYAFALGRDYWRPYKKGKAVWHPNGREGRKWKVASKGVKLTAAEICKVAEGDEIKSTLDAPTFSLYSTKNVKGSKADFIKRTIRRDDKRKRKTLLPDIGAKRLLEIRRMSRAQLEREVETYEMLLEKAPPTPQAAADFAALCERLDGIENFENSPHRWKH